MDNLSGKKCVFCNLGEDSVLFPASVNRYGPITINTRRKNGKHDSNGVIFRPYLNCEKDTKVNSSQEKETSRRRGSETNDLGIGFSENCTITDVVDRYGIFWAHEACLVWSRSNNKGNSKTSEDDHAEDIEENLKQV